MINAWSRELEKAQTELEVTQKAFREERQRRLHAETERDHYSACNDTVCAQLVEEQEFWSDESKLLEDQVRGLETSLRIVCETDATLRRKIRSQRETIEDLDRQLQDSRTHTQYVQELLDQAENSTRCDSIRRNRIP